MAEARSAPAPVLEIERLGLAFGGLRVLAGVSFSVAAGELLALIGPNGAGKTSVLNCICGIYRPAAGRILLHGRDITAEKPHRIAALGIARTFQHVELVPELSVIDNLLLGRHCRIRGRFFAELAFSRRAREEECVQREAAERVLAATELERFRHRPVGTLPYGIQKLVGFARALAMEPQVLLLDEPSAGLNRDEREDLARHILRIRHCGAIALVWVEHDMQMVADLADRICVLDRGEPIASGAPSAVLRDARVIEAYLGRRGASVGGVSV